MADARPQGLPDALLERLAHDLRGPLSPIQTAIWLLRRGGLDEARREELLDIIERQSGRLDGMIQEISDWARGHDGRLVGRRETVPVPLFLDLAAGASDPAPDWERADGLEARTIHGDVQRLVQMFGTLAGFLQARGGLARLRASPGAGMLVLTLDAAGPWEEGERSLLFAAPHPAPHDLGLGMGMLVAKQIAHAHGGGVEAGEGEGGGARVLVSLPLVPG